ncbi:MAG: FAD-binding oxidoreductase, partial [Burkholderiales bacterium]|nr:FAD-binding oxidoreductase [Burkholderiales bacterium]
MTSILDVDPHGKSLIAQAGVTLSSVHSIAASYGLEFPLTMGSQGSCTVGGLLATNAGGTAVLRYGNARSLCLGLEVVTAEGRIWNGLRRLRKDNTGYDLRDLFIGSEGTLGVITSAVLSLIPEPKTKLTAMVSLEDAHKAVQLLSLAQTRASSMLTAFELISNTCLNLVQQYFPQMPYPFKEHTPY